MAEYDIGTQGPVTIDGTTTTATFALYPNDGPPAGKLVFGDITGLTGTLSASRDGTTYVDIASVTGAGLLVAAGGTHTAIDLNELYFKTAGWKFVRYTRTAGSGPVRFVSLINLDELMIVYLSLMAGGASPGESDPVLISIRVLDSDGAQSNVAMVTVSSGTIIGVKRYSIKMDGSNTGPINATLGFAAATLATPNTTSGAGILEDFLGISAGQGVAMGDGGSILGWGASGEDLRYTVEDPAGGAAMITVTYVTKAG